MARVVGRVVLGAWLLWGVAAVWLGGVGPDGPLPWRLLALAVAGAVIAIGWHRGHLVPSAVGVAVLVSGWFVTLRPSADRAWSEDQSRLPRVEVAGDVLTVRDLRAFRYRSPSEWDARWVDRSWDLRALEGVDFGVARFSDMEAVAHTLVSFRFTDDEPLVVSVEVRKERGERYGPVRGLFRQFELMYVLADEHDALALRAVHSEHPVFLHPMRADAAQTRAFLDSVLRGAQDLVDRPRFYNTVTASCTSVLARHLQEVFGIPLDHRVYLPGYSDALAHERQLIDTQWDFDTTRERNRINERARAAAGTAGFSDAIREGRSDVRR